MKSPIINPILNKNDNKSVSFKGYTSFIDEKGNKNHKFFVPYDSQKYEVKLELVHLKKHKGEWVEDTSFKNPSSIVRLNGNKEFVIRDTSLFKADKPIDSHHRETYAIGYRYLIEDVSSNVKFNRFEPGAIAKVNVNGEKATYTILKNNRPVLNRNGLTKQVLPDICLPGYKMKEGKTVFDKPDYLRAMKAVRNHANKLGGNFAGIIELLPTWSKEGYTKIVGTPFTRDDVSSHLYWTQNIYQVAKGLGNLDDFKKLQVELFKNGINWISDGAFVNQGFQGVQFRDVLKRGSASPFYNWFKISGIEANNDAGTMELGIIPKNAAKHTRFRLVNSPKEISVGKNGELIIKNSLNSEYNFEHPTYLQLYDERLVSKEQLNQKDKILQRYEKTNTDNPYDITGHDDVTQLVAFEINPDLFEQRVRKVYRDWKENHNNSTKEFKFDNIDVLEKILKFPHFSITTKDVGGMNLWDGNMDIVKLNFYTGNSDQDVIDKGVNHPERQSAANAMLMGSFQVQDFAIQAGKYWTKLTADTQFEYITNVLNQELGRKEPTVSNYKDAIESAITKGKFPKYLRGVLTDNLLENVVNGNYKVSERSVRDPRAASIDFYLTKQAMEQPLDTLNFAPDLCAVLSSPYISKRACYEEQLSKTRYDMHFADDNDMPKEIKSVYEDMNRVYVRKITPYLVKLMNNINDILDEKHKILDDDKTKKGATEYGRYIIPLIMPEVMKYVFVQGLKPSAVISVENDKIDYSRVDMENFGLKTLCIEGSAKHAAMGVINQLKKNIPDLSTADIDLQKDLAKHFAKRIQKMDFHNLKMAEVIQEKAESGLGWRIDAAKDIADFDALRKGDDNPYQLMDEVCKFWGRFNTEVLKINKHAYSTAEITDLGEFIHSKSKGEYKNMVQAETTFIEKTGINNTANYMFFYTMLKNLFAKDVENGRNKGIGNILELKDKLDSLKGDWKDSQGFLYQYPIDSTTNSYTFIGNHDKPRPLSVFALDMGIFLSDMKKPEDQDKARRILGYDEDIDFQSVSSKAIAMGLTLKDAIEKSSMSQEEKNSLYAALKDLCQGNFLGKTFKPRGLSKTSPAADAFGTRPFDIAINDVFKQAAHSHGLKMEKDNVRAAKSALLETILTPAMEKYKTIYKMLVTLPGCPTDFIGDKEGSTGYESKSNNIYQANRNIVHFEWISDILKNNKVPQDRNKQFICDFYKEMNEIGKLRQKKELSALCNGSTISLPAQHGTCGDKPVNVAATYRYNDKKSEVICLYTAVGANEENPSMKHPQVDLDEIVLSSPRDREGILAGLTCGTKYKNANPNDQTTYKVVFENNQYKLKRENGIYHKISIMPEDKNTLILYKCPEKD